jgi:hypothetical protein
MSTKHRFTTTVLLILSLAAATPPGASAKPMPADSETVANPPLAAVYSFQDKTMVPTDRAVTAALHAPAPIALAATTGKGFDWGDAIIGMAGGLAIATLGFGGALVLSQNRARRTAA